MNLAAVAGLPLAPETRNWYRAVNPQYLPSGLRTTHTRDVTSRYSPGSSTAVPFEILYLAENHLVAQFEVGALFGAPTVPGGVVPNPVGNWTIVSVTVRLSRIADLTQVPAQQSLDTSVQELTGDWRGYRLRGLGTSVARPVGVAPTQTLGEALKRDPRRIEGFLSVSAKLPYHAVLVIFPENLGPGSFARFTYRDTAGVDQEVVVSPP